MTPSTRSTRRVDLAGWRCGAAASRGRATGPPPTGSDSNHSAIVSDCAIHYQFQVDLKPHNLIIIVKNGGKIKPTSMIVNLQLENVEAYKPAASPAACRGPGGETSRRPVAGVRPRRAPRQSLCGAATGCGGRASRRC